MRSRFVKRVRVTGVQEKPTQKRGTGEGSDANVPTGLVSPLTDKEAGTPPHSHSNSSQPPSPTS